MPDDSGGPDEKRRDFQRSLDASSIGWLFPIAIAIGVGAGWGLDKLFGTRPWLMIVFGAFGVIAAFVQLFRIGLRDGGGNE
jgi:ATP synthase protein I